MPEKDGRSAELEYVESVKEVIEALKETQAGGEVIMTLASIWAQAKASELTTLNVVRSQMEGGSGFSADDLENRVGEIERALRRPLTGSFDHGRV